jgi:FIMAH domain/Beta-propeller repeat
MIILVTIVKSQESRAQNKRFRRSTTRNRPKSRGSWASRELVIDPEMLVYSGFIGGSSNEGGTGIAVDTAGSAYIIGSTQSPDLPVAVGPDTSFNNGGPLGRLDPDVFVAKVRADGTGLVYCGYIGGSGGDTGLGIAVDSAGNAYVTGSSISSDFPVTVGPDTSFNGGVYDAFVAKVRADGTRLDYCGYIGGSSSDGGSGIAVDGRGNAYITGSTGSSDFPVVVGPNTSFNGIVDAWVAKIVSPRLSPREAIGQLIDLVEALVAAGHLKPGQGGALINRPEVALKQLDRDHIKQAVNQLESFARRVDRLIDRGELAPAEGQSLIEAANEIIAELERQ